MVFMVTFPKRFRGVTDPFCYRGVSLPRGVIRNIEVLRFREDYEALRRGGSQRLLGGVTQDNFRFPVSPRSWFGRCS